MWCDLDRDFDLQTLDGNQVGQYLQLWYEQHDYVGNFAWCALKKGEILPDIDVEEEVELVPVKRSLTTSSCRHGAWCSCCCPNRDQKKAREQRDSMMSAKV